MIIQLFSFKAFKDIGTQLRSTLALISYDNLVFTFDNSLMLPHLHKL